MKTLVDEIRDMVGEARTRGMYPMVTDAASGLIGRRCWSVDDEAELFTLIADRIEQEYLPRPRFEDGEHVKVGDMVLWNDNEAKRVEVIRVEVHLEGACGTYNSVLKRPEPEVLDADGVPIKVGDHVWWKDGREFVVTAVNRGVDTEAVEPANGMCSSHVNFDPKEFTHKQPDTMERIKEDARFSAFYYWGCCDFRCEECPALIDGKTPEDHYHVESCEYAMILDLLRRQRELLERGQA